MKSLFLDMDGCLAEYKDVPLKALYEQGYFANLKPIENVVNGLKLFTEEHPEVKVSVLSCVLNDRPNAAEEKIAWLKEYCPFLMKSVYFVPCGTNKSILANDDENYLLDDYDKKFEIISKYTQNLHYIDDPWYSGEYEIVINEIWQCCEDIIKNLK